MQSQMLDSVLPAICSDALQFTTAQCIAKCWTEENAGMLASYKLQKRDGGENDMQAFVTKKYASSINIIASHHFNDK